MHCAPVCKVPEKVPSQPDSLFGGEASLLEAAAKEEREKKRDDALFKRPVVPNREIPKKKKGKVPHKSTAQKSASSQPFSAPLASVQPSHFRSDKKSTGARGRGRGSSRSKCSYSGKVWYSQRFAPSAKSRKVKHSYSRSTFKRILACLGETGGKPLDSNCVEERLLPEVQEVSASLSETSSFQSTSIPIKTPSFRSGDTGYDCKRRCGNRTRRVPRILQSGLCGPKIVRRLATSDRSVCFKSVPEGSKVFNGNSGIYKEGHASGSVDSIFGPQRCLLSCSDSCQAQKVSEVLLQRSNLAVQSPSLRTGPCSLDFYHDRQGSTGHCPQGGLVSASIPGRLDSEESVKRDTTQAQGSAYCSLCPIGLHTESSEIRARTQTGFCVCRLQIQNSTRGSVALAGEIRKDSLSNLSVPEVQISDCLDVSVSVRSPVILRETCSSGSTSHEIPATRSEGSMVTVSGSLRRSDQNFRSFCAGSTVVDRLVQSHSRFPISSPRSNSPSVHRCIQGRLGSTLEFCDCVRHMGRCCLSLAYQCAGVGSCFPRPFPLGTGYEKTGGISSLGQLDCGLLCKQTGGNKVGIFGSRDQETLALVSRQTDCSQGETHSRQTECFGRFPLQTRSNSPFGVVTVSSGVCLPVYSVGYPLSRSLCHQVESQGGSVCVTDSRSPGMASRCLVNELGSAVGICISTHSSNIPSSVQGGGPQVSVNLGSTHVARQELVSGSTGLVNRSPQIVASQVEPAETTQECNVPQASGQLESARVSVVQQSLRKKGFSSEVSRRISKPNRSSSLAVYQSKWSSFAHWCVKRKTDPLKASVPLISEFLLEKFKAGRAPSTLDGYRTAIAKTLIHFTGVNLGDDRNLSALLHNFHLEKSKTRNPVPEWDLSLVLNCLLKDPFEPLDKAHIKLVTWKTVFLLALASGKRRGELHALSFNSLAYSPQGDTAHFKVIPSFMAKTQLVGSSSLSFSIPSLSTVLGPGMEEDNLLCPIRALKIYVARTQRIRENKSLLFVSYKPGFTKDIRSATISFWLKKLIRLCYDIAKTAQPGPLAVRAHDIRAMSASLAFLSKVPIERVMESCTWKSHNTFSSFYLRDLTLHSEEVLRLGPLVVAQEVVRAQ